MRSKLFISALSAAALMVLGQSCVDIDTQLGQGLIPEGQKFEVHTATIPLENIQMKNLDYMSGYSTSRVTIGSIRDEELGLTTRSSAFWLSPMIDTIDFGTNTKLENFNIYIVRDTTSYLQDNQEKIIQNIYVHSLADADMVLDSTVLYTNSFKRSKFDGLRSVCKGTPLYAGGESLSFDLSDDFAQEMLDKMLDMRNSDGLLIVDSLAEFAEKLPGIFVSTDDPVGNGGRINMFDHTFSITSSGYIEGSFAQLNFTADFGDRKNVDTVAYFIIGSLGFATGSSDIPTQYAFNITESEGRIPEGTAQEMITIEGGSGLKPVISSEEIRTKILREISQYTNNPQEITINKSTIVLPFQFPENYTDMKLYPQVLNPTCRIKSSTRDDYYTYASLTDASISSENQGDVDRSLCVYRPDVSFFTQKVMNLEDPDEETYANYDIWFLIMANEIVESSSSSSSSSYSDYYTQMMYYNYLNSMYGGYGYGSYSGYGYGSSYGYNSYYNNYYSMYYLSSLLNSSSSSSTTTTETQLDRDRFYNGKLYGPKAEDTSKRPYLEVTYAVPLKDAK